MSRTLLLVLIFLLCNIIGSIVSPVAYWLSIKYGIIDIYAEGFNLASMQKDFILRTQLTWLVCCLFSFSAFFLKDLWRKLFLLCPIFIPLIYGLLLLQSYT